MTPMPHSVRVPARIDRIHLAILLHRFRVKVICGRSTASARAGSATDDEPAQSRPLHDHQHSITITTKQALAARNSNTRRPRGRPCTAQIIGACCSRRRSSIVSAFRRGLYGGLVQRTRDASSNSEHDARDVSDLAARNGSTRGADPNRRVRGYLG